MLFANPDAAVYISRRRVNDAFLRAALESFHKDGPVAFQKCARENPASYLKIFALLVPRELKIEHANPASALSDEQLAQMIAELEERIARRVAAGEAKQIDVEPTAGEATTPLVLAPPKRRQNRLMMEADTAIGPRSAARPNHRGRAMLSNRQSLQKSLNRSGAISVYRAVCWMFLCPR